jgi:hypothetical protein
MWIPRTRAASVALMAVTSIGMGCASLTVNSYVARSFDTGRYQTYDWAAADRGPTGDPRLDNNRFFDEHVRRQIEKQLASKGFEKTTSATPDLLLHYHASVTQEIDIRNLDRHDQYCDEENCEPFVYDAGTLFIDFVDPRTDRLVWRGWAEGSIEGLIDNQEWLEDRIDEVVARILERLPRRSILASPTGESYERDE